MRVCLLGFILAIAAAAQDSLAPAVSDSNPAPQPAFWSWAERPVMGWNSWDCFGAGVNEDQTLANAQYMKDKLLAHGYSLITVDIQWYEPLAHTTEYRRGAVLEMDPSGRLLPAPNRFPLTKDTRSFKPLADKLHAMGLKFGLHLMRGIPRQAVDQDVLIVGTEKLKEGGIHAADIASKTDVCRWNTDMYGVDMSKPGAQEYYDSVLALMASWEIDFIKVDDLSAPRYHTAEVEAIRKAIDKTNRPIVLSTSPGATPISQGSHVQTHANQWRISNDFWDDWRALYAQFRRLNDWTAFRGPGRFPDADMLPLGNVRAWQETGNWTRLSHDEQLTLMTLWSIARSPLIIGANLPKNDEFTLSILTNDEVIAVDQDSTNNHQLFNRDGQIAWLADVPNSKAKYLALFNTASASSSEGRSASSPPGPQATRAGATTSAESATVSVPLTDIGLAGPCRIRDLWAHQDLADVEETVSAGVRPHGAVLYRLEPR
jgi:alpha-galactosidase